MAENTEVESDSPAPESAPPRRVADSAWWGMARFAALACALVFYVGNAHHTMGHEKDFLSHWTLAKLAASGAGAGIYDPELQKQTLRANLAAEKLVLANWFIPGVGISPYPPVMTLLYLPLGWLTPALAQWVMVQLSVALACLSAWAISRAVDGRVRFTTAWLAILYFPGFFYTIALGQNAILTLALWSLGWLALRRDREMRAGLVWGLLSYKLHWVVAVGWAPAALGKWRAYLGLATSLIGLAALVSLLFGVDVWQAWIERMRAFSSFYEGEPQQLGKALDLRALAYRYLPADRAGPTGWLALAAVAGISLLRFRHAVSRTRNADRAGAPVAPLLFAAGLIAPYLMYYDGSVFLLPLLVLWADRDRYTRGETALLALLTAGFYLGLPIMDHWPDRWQGPPWQTFVTLALWGFSLWTCRANRS